jgi:hypothetical protein
MLEQIDTLYLVLSFVSFLFIRHRDPRQDLDVVFVRRIVSIASVAHPSKGSGAGFCKGKGDCSGKKRINLKRNQVCLEEPEPEPNQGRRLLQRNESKECINSTRCLFGSENTSRTRSRHQIR